MSDPMAMYDPLRRQAQGLQYKFQDYTAGMGANPQARVLQNEIHRLNEDIAMKKNPHDIESRIKTIQHGMIEAQHAGPPYMNYDHHGYMHTGLEQLRQNLHQLPHY